jgi:MurE/MurF fusion protein
VPGVPGRVERVANAAGLDIFVDYAHTPDALDNLLTALRPLTRRRLLCVFGCGGDRDPGKRPHMGAVVAAKADLPIVTSDNPRTEDPRAIVAAIVPAVPNAFYVDVDRRTAIRAAIAVATPGDIVVIAGKGHEDYQIIGTTKHHFDDREEAAAAVGLRPSWTTAQIATIVGGQAVGPMRTVSRIGIDGRAAGPGDLYVAIRGERVDGHDFASQAIAAGAVAVMVEPGRAQDAITAIEVAEPRTALAALAGEYRRRWRAEDPTRRLIAITGSAGKTTTKELTRAAVAGAGATHAAIGSHNNETGVPLTILGLRAHHRYGVVEMGMRGAGQIDYLTQFARPDVAAVVNAGSAHIELLGSVDAIADAKGEIYGGLDADGVAVAPADDPRLLAHARARAASSRVITFGDHGSAAVRLTGYQAVGADGGDLHVDVSGHRRRFRLPLIGRHAAIDATCALACAIAAGVDLDVAIHGLESARPTTMRGEVVTIAGRHIIIDCYNANPASMAAAITTLAELRGSATAVAVLGDMLELGDHAAAAHVEVGAQLGALMIPVVALGAFRQQLADATGAPAAAWTTDDPQVAARQVLATTAPGDWVLIKASRGMRLERVVAALRELAS